MTDLSVKAADGGAFAAYVALPEKTPAPGVVVIQEIFGVNQVMRDLCDGLAARGYVAASPDLFWRIEPGIRLTDRTDGEWKRAFELFGLFDVDKGVDDLKATIATLRGLSACSGKVGAVGYCLGGQLAYLTATRTDADCSVGYYGVQIDQLLDEAVNISKPLMLHIAGKDEFVPADARARMRDGLSDNILVTLHDYPDRDHAFARVGGAHWHETDAATANKRTAEFFRQHLGA